MIVILRGNVLLELRGLRFGHRSKPSDELVADHLLGQLPRRAAVRRDDPAAPRSPRLLPSRHHSLQSSGSYARGHCERSEEHTSELQSQSNLVCRLLLEKKKKMTTPRPRH